MRISDWSSDVCSSDLFGDRWSSTSISALSSGRRCGAWPPYAASTRPSNASLSHRKQNRPPMTCLCMALPAWRRKGGARSVAPGARQGAGALVCRSLEIGSAHDRDPDTQAKLVCHLLLVDKEQQN